MYRYVLSTADHYLDYQDQGFGITHRAAGRARPRLARPGYSPGSHASKASMSH